VEKRKSLAPTGVRTPHRPDHGEPLFLPQPFISMPYIPDLTEPEKHILIKLSKHAI
jgi:hypothetical protein